MKDSKGVLWTVSSHRMLKILPGFILLMMMSTFSVRSAVAQTVCSGSGFPADDYVCVNIADNGVSPVVSQDYDGSSPLIIGTAAAPVTIGDYEVALIVTFAGSTSGIGITIDGTITRTSAGTSQLGLVITADGGWSTGAVTPIPPAEYGITLDVEASGTSSTVIGGALGYDASGVQVLQQDVAWESNPGGVLDAVLESGGASNETENFLIPVNSAGEINFGGAIWALRNITAVHINNVGTIVDIPSGIVVGSPPLNVSLLGESFEVLQLDVEGVLEHFRKSQFRLAGPDACEEDHWHSNTGSAISLEGNTLSDPNPTSCGYGKESEATILDLSLITEDTTAATSVTIGPEEVLFVDSSATLTIPANLTLTNTSNTIINLGTINNQGTITNTGTIANTGTITNECGGTVNNTGTITGNSIIEETCQAIDPTPNILANGSGGTLSINEGDQLSIGISLDPGSNTGTSAVWYIAVKTPSGWQSFNLTQMDYSTSGLSALLQDVGLVSFGSVEIFSTLGLSAGTYTYYFAVIIGDGLFLDSVVVNVQ